MTFVQPNRKFLRDARAFRGIFPAQSRAVAQLGRALEWGSRGPGFKSRQPDFPNLGGIASIRISSRNLQNFSDSAVRGEFAVGF
jgi:hypothetical protein